MGRREWRLLTSFGETLLGLTRVHEAGLDTALPFADAQPHRNSSRT